MTVHLEFVQSSFCRPGGLWSEDVIPSQEANFPGGGNSADCSYVSRYFVGL